MTPSRFKTIRKKSGLSQAELAEKLNVAENTITRYEIGNRRISPRADAWMQLFEHRLQCPVAQNPHKFKGKVCRKCYNLAFTLGFFEEWERRGL